MPVGAVGRWPRGPCVADVSGWDARLRKACGVSPGKGCGRCPGGSPALDMRAGRPARTVVQGAPGPRRLGQKCVCEQDVRCVPPSPGSSSSRNPSREEMRPGWSFLRGTSSPVGKPASTCACPGLGTGVTQQGPGTERAALEPLHATGKCDSTCDIWGSVHFVEILSSYAHVATHRKILSEILHLEA